MRNHIILGAVLLSLTSMASAVEKIGVIDVTVDGQQSQWQTIRHANSDGVDASARVYRIGPMTSLEIQGQGEGTFSMEVLFPGAARPDARPAGVDIILFPKGERITGTRWTSEDAGVAPTVTFDVLKIGEADGRAEGKFTARLCRVKGYGETDKSDCKEVAGRFATDMLVVEQ
jgi:hypothetical protein